jgi:hypothetical protein
VKRICLYLILLSFLSLVSGYLLSKLSMTGRVGVNLLYKQYKFLKDPFKDFFLIFLVFLILISLLYIFYKRWNKNIANKISLIIVFLGIAGALLTYYDFAHNLSHRLLGWRFHLGAYLFWLGWICIPIYYLTKKEKADL